VYQIRKQLKHICTLTSLFFTSVLSKPLSGFILQVFILQDRSGLQSVGVGLLRK